MNPFQHEGLRSGDNMKLASLSILLVSVLGLGCGANQDRSGNQPSGGTAGLSESSAGASGTGDRAGGPSSGGPAAGSSGAGMGGGNDSASGAGASNAGAPSSMGPGAGGQTQWPAWVGQCMAIRAEKCACSSQECLVCVFGTDAELASTGVKCDEPLRNYQEGCACHTSGCPLHCRPEYE